MIQTKARTKRKSPRTLRFEATLGKNLSTQAETLFGQALTAVPTDGTTWAGELWVAMLDTKAGWDELIRRHAPDQVLARRVLANPLYHNITSRFVNSHDYLAMEQLYDLHASGRYDLVVVDAAPTGETLRLLSLPEAGRWWLDRVYPIQRKLAQLASPIVGRVTGMPTPANAVSRRMRPTPHFTLRLKSSGVG